jgi:hypothetical protein
MSYIFGENELSPSQDWEYLKFMSEESRFALYMSLYAPLIQNPSLSGLRGYYLDLLQNLFFNPTVIAKDISELGDFDDKELEMISKFIFSEASYIATVGGLVLRSEINSITSQIEPQYDALPLKYLTWQQAKDFTRDFKEVGLIHGSFDPTHIGHAGLAQIVYAHSEILLVGFDSDESLNQRKGARNDSRPRFPLAWRMFEMASLPTVAGVFVLPTDENTGSDTYAQIYKELGISVLGCGVNNVYLKEYENRMAGLGGRVVTQDLEMLSSTRLMQLIALKEPGALPEQREIMRIAKFYEIVALEMGFLHDFQ